MKRQHAFTLIELLVVISIIALLIAILLPALGAARRTARAMQSNTQVRGIQQGMFVFAQSNKTLYPGMDVYDVSADVSLTNAGKIKNYTANDTTTPTQAGGDVAARYVICVNNELFTPEYLISPLEVNKSVTPWDASVTYFSTSVVSSYALPRIRNNTNMATGRAKEWSDNANANAIVVSDRLFRNTGASPTVVQGDATTHYSLQSTDIAGKWTGGVSFNDNHVENYQTSQIDTVLSYANYKTIGPDNIFTPTTPTGQTPPAADATSYNAQQVIREHDTALIADD